MKEFKYKVLMCNEKFVDMDNLHLEIKETEYPKLLPINTNFNNIIDTYVPLLVTSNSHSYLIFMGNLNKCILKEIILQL